MFEAEKKEIEDLLDKIFVFDYEFKLDILTKIENEGDGGKFTELKKILSEALEIQNLLVDKKMNTDKDFYKKIQREKRVTDEKIIKLYKEKLSQDDNQKINLILSKIDSI